MAVLSSLAKSGDLAAEVAAWTPEMQAAVAAVVSSAASSTSSSLPVGCRDRRGNDIDALPPVQSATEEWMAARVPEDDDDLDVIPEVAETSLHDDAAAMLVEEVVNCQGG